MYRKRFDKKVVIIIAVLMLAMLQIITSGCGAKSFEGKWYDVSAVPLVRYEIKPDGELKSFSGTGTWEDLGNGTIHTKSAFGIEKDFHLEKWEGYEVMVSESSSSDAYCRTAEDAEALFDLLYN